MKKFILLIFLVNSVSSIATSAVLITATAGKVSDHIVTTREAQINHYMEQALYGKRVTELKADVKNKAFQRQVTSVLLEWIVYMEAQGFAAVTVSKAELQKAESSLIRKVAGLKSWQKLGVTAKEMREMLRRKLVAKKFIQFKVDSSVVPITDAEARAYFESNRVKFGDLPFENFKDNIKSFLSRQQVDRRLKDWFEVLQAKFKVRNYLVE